jgi:class 3 adenylate cyclase
MFDQRNKTEAACLVIADITGYTSYLAGVELDHAQDILADLMDTVIRSLRPTFRLAKLEGDAAFTYVDVYTAKYKLISEAKKLGNVP